MGDRRVATLLIAGASLWAFWPTLGRLVHAWLNDSQYSHGLLVPVFWRQRDALGLDAWSNPPASLEA